VATTATYTINPYPNGIANNFTSQRIKGTVTISSGTYPTGGYPAPGNANVVWAAGSQEQVKSLLPPNELWFQSIAHPPSGYEYCWDQTANTMRIFQSAGSAAPMVEISGSVPAGVTGDTIQFVMEVPRGS
jgi:hypothetical protein